MQTCASSPLGSSAGRSPGRKILRAAGLRCLLLMSMVANPMADGAEGSGLAGPKLEVPPNAFARGLQEKAASKSRDDLVAVRAALTNETSLLQINTASEYAELLPDQLAIHKILATLARNPASDAAETIAVLCESAPFLAEPARVESLLLTLPAVRPLPARALPFLQQSSRPESDSLAIAIGALFEIGSPSTLEIFSGQVLGGKHDEVLVQSWFRDPLLRHRRDDDVLQMSLQLLRQPKFDTTLKNTLVECLFDYRPHDWYVGSGPHPKPPSRKKLAPAAAASLREIVTAIQNDPAVTAANKALAAK